MIVRPPSFGTCLALGACFVLGACQKAELVDNAHAVNQGGPPKLLEAWAPFVRVHTVTADSNVAYHRATGLIAYDEDRTQRVVTSLSGRVLAVHVNLGDEVKLGDALLTMASPEATQLRGEAQRARLAYASAERSVLRVRTLRQDGAISERDAIAAEAELVQARALSQSTQAHLQALGFRLDASGGAATLLARQAGRITDRHVVVGQEVRSDTVEPLITVSNLNAVWLITDVFEQDLDHVQRGGTLRLQVPAYPDHYFEGTVQHVSDVLDPITHTVKVRATVPNADQRLKPDMFATVEFAQSHGLHLTVPSQAVVSDHEHDAVIVVGSQDLLDVRPVRLGPLRDGQHEVLTGLEPNTRIVVLGAPFILQTMRE